VPVVRETCCEGWTVVEGELFIPSLLGESVLCHEGVFFCPLAADFLFLTGEVDLVGQSGCHNAYLFLFCCVPMKEKVAVWLRKEGRKERRNEERKEEKRRKMSVLFWRKMAFVATSIISFTNSSW
jgi:hypothetical protein